MKALALTAAMLLPTAGHTWSFIESADRFTDELITVAVAVNSRNDAIRFSCFGTDLMLDFTPHTYLIEQGRFPIMIRVGKNEVNKGVWAYHSGAEQQVIAPDHKPPQIRDAIMEGKPGETLAIRVQGKDNVTFDVEFDIYENREYIDRVFNACGLLDFNS